MHRTGEGTDGSSVLVFKITLLKPKRAVWLVGMRMPVCSLCVTLFALQWSLWGSLKSIGYRKHSHRVSSLPAIACDWLGYSFYYHLLCEIVVSL